MTKLEHAIALAAQGFHVFPITPGAKQPPLIQDFPNKASRLPGVIADWWAQWPEANIGISTSKYGDDQALLVIDVDNKKGKHGDATLLRLELEGRELPDTYTQTTPTGGRHLVFSVRAPLRQGTNVLGPGLDTRSSGGYILGAGSELAGGGKYAGAGTVVAAPEWLVGLCGNSPQRRSRKSVNAISVNRTRAERSAIEYLRVDAPLAIEGQGGDDLTYTVAARVKDFGVDEATCAALMAEHWNPRCSPPWSMDDLREKARRAFAYGKDVPGCAAPEADFTPVPQDPLPSEDIHPYDRLNREYAFVVAGGGHHILWETTDPTGKYKLEHLTPSAFHAKFAPQKILIGKKESSVSHEWLAWKGRRGYDGLVFLPEQQAPDRFYNLWRGFAVEPAEEGCDATQHPAVEAFFDHARANVCRGDVQLCRWLLGYFAHLVQRPWEKPLVSCVFKGGKGVGKNALIERVGALLGGHFLLTSNRRYLVGNFNGHLESCLLFALDEAFWSGDKQAEGILKDLITGREHLIEHKGKEPYTVQNKTRVVIIGNEDWLIPASYDERRFAVFEVGEGRKQDRAYFQAMREGMEAGGYRHLLRYLLDYDLTGLDLNAAPSTQGLVDQKHLSLGPLQQWWLDCLENGSIVCGDFPGWPEEIECDRLRGALRRYVKERQIGSRLPEDRAIGRYMKQCAPGVLKRRMSRQADGEQPYCYTVPPLAEARAQWDAFVQHPVEWTA